MAFDGIAPEWRECKGFPDYEVSSVGEVRRAGRVLKPWRHRLGYLTLNLRANNASHRRYIHRLVAETFIGAAPPRHEIDHINGQRDDNRAVNLRWVTHAENMAARAPGTRGTRRDGALTEQQAIEIRRRRKDGVPLLDVAREFGITVGMVSHIARGRRWKYLVGAEDIPPA